MHSCIEKSSVNIVLISYIIYGVKMGRKWRFFTRHTDSAVISVGAVIVQELAQSTSKFSVFY